MNVSQIQRKWHLKIWRIIVGFMRCSKCHGHRLRGILGIYIKHSTCHNAYEMACGITGNFKAAIIWCKIIGWNPACQGLTRSDRYISQTKRTIIGALITGELFLYRNKRAIGCDIEREIIGVNNVFIWWQLRTFGIIWIKHTIGKCRPKRLIWAPLCQNKGQISNIISRNFLASCDILPIQL